MSAPTRVLIHVAILLSGAASLVYQVAWARRLASVTSATTTANAVVLALFMGGAHATTRDLVTTSGESRLSIKVRIVNEDQGPYGVQVEEVLRDIQPLKVLRSQSIESVDRLVADRHRYPSARHCPHGRPTSLLLTRQELDRQFRRT